jgi:hypothetical protein
MPAIAAVVMLLPLVAGLGTIEELVAATGDDAVDGEAIEASVVDDDDAIESSSPGNGSPGLSI